jgi:Domain of Unknown Function (DUF1259)
MRKTLFGMIAATALSLTGPAHADPDWKAVGAALGKDGVVQPGGVYRVGLPRSDLKVVLDGVELKPAFALGSWRGEDLTRSLCEIAAGLCDRQRQVGSHPTDLRRARS